jgi:hypothetical protein
MPAQSSWFSRLSEILAELRDMQAPVVDRALLERLFGVRRRRAIQLLSRFGGFLSGRTYLVDRLELVCQLEALQSGSEFGQERRRRQRLSCQLDGLRKHRAAAEVRVPIPAGALSARPSQLPEGVSLECGRLTVEFAGVEDLIRKLFILSQAAANDFDAFRAVAEESVKAH